MADGDGARLERHRPRLRYDSQETFFADSASEWTDAPANVLQRRDGTVLAEAREAGGRRALSLALLAPGRYRDPARSPVRRDDCIGHCGRDYVQAARRLHALPRYGNRMYGRASRGSDGRVWLQYWFFYFYNDYNLIGPLIGAGLHEGDWETVQLRLDATGATPDLAVYAQHKGAEARRWPLVQRDGVRPIVYPARGSHASYFEAADDHWTGHWFDHADGRRATPELTLVVVEETDRAFDWIRWPGAWGDTRKGASPLDSGSPVGPGAHPQWADPHLLLLKAQQPERFDVPPQPPGPPPTAPPAPSIALARDGIVLHVAYDCPGWPAERTPAGLVVTINSPQEPLPPAAHRVPISTPSGSVTIADVALRPDWSYDVTVSIADSDGIASPSTRTELPAAP
jgi:hypothetical protein